MTRSLWFKLFVPASITAILLSTAAVRAEETVIGIVHSEGFAYAEMMKRSYEIAMEDVNRGAGEKGLRFRLAFADDRGDRRGAEEAVQHLAKSRGAAILVGGYSSSNTLYAAMAADRIGIPFVVITAADDRITRRQLTNVYRLNPPSSDYTNGLEAFFQKVVSPRSMAIVYENSPYGTGAAMKMMWYCRENDIELLAIIPYIRGRAKDAYFDRILSPLREKSPDVVYMVSYLKDGAELVKKLRSMNLKSLLCGGAGGFTHPRFNELSGEDGNLMITAALWAPETGFSGAMAYRDRYESAYQTAPDYHGVEAFSSIHVAAEALRTAASLSADAIREALDRLDMETPFGRVRFESDGDYERQNRVDTLVLQLVSGRYECIWPESLSTTTFEPPPYWRAD
jgi:branched-chain amino acid transport system substrate-binding protein